MKIVFPPLNFTKLKLIAYGDANFDNLPNGGSHGENLLVFTDGTLFCPLQWDSTQN